MTQNQFDIFTKMLTGFKVARVGDYTFTIKERFNGIYELKQIYNGSEIILKVAPFDDCVCYAKETVNMIFGLSD